MVNFWCKDFKLVYFSLGLVDKPSMCIFRVGHRFFTWKTNHCVIYIFHKCFHLSRTKIEYMECKFSKSKNKNKWVVRLDGQEILKSNNFQYLRSIIRKYGEIEEDLNHRIKAGWMKWRSVSGTLCDHKIPTKLKGKFIRLLYDQLCFMVLNVGLLRSNIFIK